MQQITQELREYAQQHQLDEADALKVPPALAAVAPCSVTPTCAPTCTAACSHSLVLDLITDAWDLCSGTFGAC